MITQGIGGREFGAFACHVAAFAGRRLWAVALLGIAAAGAEGLGLVMLAPLLGHLGIAGSGQWVPAALGLGAALATYVTLVAAAALVVATRAVAVARLRFNYMDDLRRRVQAALLSMEWRSFSRLRASDAAHIMTTEIQRSAQGLDFLLRLGGWTVEILTLMAVALHLSPAMTALCLGLAALGAVLSRPLNRRVHAMGRQTGEAMRALHGDMTDDLAGMRLLRGLGLETERQARLEARLEAVHRSQLASQRWAAHSRAAQQVVAAMVAALAVWFSVRVLDNALADTLVLLAALARLVTTTLRFQDAWRMVLNTLPAHAAVTAFLDQCLAAAEPAAPDGVTDTPPPELNRGVELDDVVFRYGQDGPPALSHLSAHIPARAVTAVVGSSGAGKSTLADLLSGLVEANGGRVLVDGVPLAGAARRAWRRQVGYVPQDCILFHDTIRANLTLGAPEAGDAALWSALDTAAAGDFVRAQPRGLDTMVGDHGSQFSGGQRQRLWAASPRRGPLRLLATGRLVERKNVDTLLAALARLPARCEVVLRVGGDGPHRVRLERLVAELGLDSKVEFAGFIQPDRLPEHLAWADVYAFPTTREVWGIVLNEALAGGLYALASTDAGASHDLIDEGNGHLLDPRDPAAWTAAITRCAAERDSLRQGRWERAEAAMRFDTAVMAPRFVAALQSAVGPS